MKNFFLASLHIEGTLPPDDEITALFGRSWSMKRRGEVLRNGEVSLVDSMYLRLAQWEVVPLAEDAEGINHFVQIAMMIKAFTPALQRLQDTDVTKGLRLGMVRRTDQGGITFPREFVRTVAEAGLSIHLSITVILDDDDDDNDDDDNDDDDRDDNGPVPTDHYAGRVTNLS